MKEENSYIISTDKSKIDLHLVHHYLSQESYWAKNIPLHLVERSIENSLVFGVYQGKNQVGFARIISDFATFAYLADVFILTEHRGLGLSKMLLEHITGYPSLQGLRKWVLGTADAHELYKKFGWDATENPSIWMERQGFTGY